MNSSEGGPRLVIPAFGAIYDALKPCTPTILRIAMGCLFIPHGLQKLFGAFGAPTIDQFSAGFGKALGPAFGTHFWVYAIGSLELFGGCLLVVGLFTRPVAALFFGFMATAACIAQVPNGWFWTRPGGGVEMPVSWGIVCLVILVNGSGKWSIDRMIGKEL
jgi:putative oxidoreductase